MRRPATKTGKKPTTEKSNSFKHLTLKKNTDTNTTRKINEQEVATRKYELDQEERDQSIIYCQQDHPIPRSYSKIRHSVAAVIYPSFEPG